MKFLPIDFAVSGKRVLIPGTSLVIGAAATEAFVEECAHLRLTARSGEELAALAWGR
jgi:NADP-dependent 3-hydroxy acid dehydrogenase YdfG